MVARALLLVLFLVAASAGLELERQPAKSRIEGSYIVVLKENMAESSLGALKAKIVAMDTRNEIGYEYSVVYSGFSAKLTPTTLAHLLELNDTIEMITEDGMAHGGIPETEKACLNQPITQTGLWGLRRISRAGCGLGSNANFQYGSNAGAGVTCYVLDTGIRITHNEFEGRAVTGVRCDNRNSCQNASGNIDGHGHGTHVASTVGGKTYGVAKRTRLVAVKVLADNNAGSWSGIIAGIDWTAGDAQPGDTANMSIYGGANSAVDSAVNSAVGRGIFFAICAGNDNGDACTNSPARAANSYTVASLQSTSGTTQDTRSSFSDSGSCVDIFAPGSSVLGAWYNSDTATNTISGTSMATPHVCGYATIISAENGRMTPAQIKAQLDSTATKNCISNPGYANTPNAILYAPCTE